MRKLIAIVCAAGALALPGAPAVASDIPPPAGVNRCPAGFTGAIVWHYDPVERDYDYYNFCIH